MFVLIVSSLYKTHRDLRGNVWWDLYDGGQNLSLCGWNRIKVSENLGATAVVPVASVDTFL